MVDIDELKRLAQPAEAEGAGLRAMSAGEWAERAPSRNVVLEDEAIAALSAVIAERDQLRAEAEALRKDAERYRWLKDQGHFRAMSVDMGGNHAWAGMGRSVGAGGTVDAAIDTAMAAKEVNP